MHPKENLPNNQWHLAFHINMIFIIITVYNRKDFTRQCLLSLRQQTFKEFKIVVVDDGSTDGTEEMLANEFPEVHVIKGDGNLWWTGAMNLGLEYVLKISNDDDYVLTLNNDLFVNSDYLEKIFNAEEKMLNSLIGSISVDAENKTKILDAGVKVNWLTAKFYGLADQIIDLNNFEKIKDFQPVDVLPA